FPDTPWVRIPANFREARLKANAEEFRESSPPKDRPLVFTPFREFMEDVLPERGIDSRSNPEDNRYVVVEISFAAEDPAIVGEFKARLKAYREWLKKRFNKMVEVRKAPR